MGSRGPLIAGILVALLCLVPVGNAQEIGKKQKELTTIKKEIQDKQKKIKDASKEEKSILTQLSEMDRNLSSKEKELASIIRQIEDTGHEIEELEKLVADLEAKLAAKKEDIDKRIVALYKLGGTGYLPFLLYAKGADDLKRSAKYLSAVIYSDQALFAAYREDHDALEKNVRELKEKRIGLLFLKDSADKKTLELVGEKERRTAYLIDIRREKSSYEQALVELQAAEKELSALIERLRIEEEKRASEARERAAKKPPTDRSSSPPAGGRFAGLKGRLPYPASGAVVTKYGKSIDPKYDNPVYSKGIEIEAPAGSPIIAVADGSVIYADYFSGYGNLIIIDHGDSYYTVYAHAKSLLRKVGETVKANDTIGTVGDTGSLKGPILYFEIRHHGDTTDPEKWLATR